MPNPELTEVGAAFEGLVTQMVAERAQAVGAEFTAVVDNPMKNLIAGLDLKGLSGVTVTSEGAGNSVPNAAIDKGQGQGLA